MNSTFFHLMAFELEPSSAISSRYDTGVLLVGGTSAPFPCCSSAGKSRESLFLNEHGL